MEIEGVMMLVPSDDAQPAFSPKSTLPGMYGSPSNTCFFQVFWISGILRQEFLDKREKKLATTAS
jgi:hypothetical protein